MVIICISSFLRMLLLYFWCYFHRILLHSPLFSGLYWIFGPIWLSAYFYSDFICIKGCFWIKILCAWEEFVILRVFGWNINGKYCLNTCVVSLSSFWFLWLSGNAVFILIICALHTFLSAFSYIIFYNLYALSSVDASQELYLGTVVNWALFNAN